MLSVALCTYNGAHYLREQLESIINQTMKVDEIVVCDDGSTDNTLSLIENIFKDTSIDIHIYHNEQNLGVCANFQKAVNLCHGDIIFLSDQDDVWYPDKVKSIMDFFKKNKDKQVVFSNGQLINDDGAIINTKTLWDTIGFTPQAQKSLTDGFGPEIFSYENRATGASMAFQRSFVDDNPFLNICNNTILHDGVLAMLGISTNSLGFIAQPLINYRIHSRQVVGIGNSFQSSISDDARETSPLCEQWYSVTLPSPLKERITFIRARHRRKQQPLGPFRMIGSIGNYIKYYRGMWISFLLFDLKKWATAMWRA